MSTGSFASQILGREPGTSRTAFEGVSTEVAPPTHERRDAPPSPLLEPPSARRFSRIRSELANSSIGLIHDPSPSR